ncbi:MAG TPA: type II toxin-antitoxin system RelB/DinJ family antitoxin [Acetomicrobium flavidum]|uniref:type II toxin-antitoxin system RelB/DinJ family antitoxin n=1 Tax=Acetomicrobium flavidum TaxID=49896 RepID=UPI002C620334|nr:type II toxin-antitoxin system RelB/DinJ family antitoxin [Acetomicrobium flavidum]
MYSYIVSTKVVLTLVRTCDSMIRVRINSETKERAARVLDGMGLTLSDAVRMFLVRIAEEGRFPFEIEVPKAKEEKPKPKTLEEIKRIINSHRKELEEKYKVKSIAVFGSYARGEQTEDSDVDIMVEFSEPVGLKFFGLADFLEDILGIKVDLATPDGIKPNRKEYVMEDLCYV